MMMPEVGSKWRVKPRSDGGIICNKCGYSWDDEADYWSGLPVVTVLPIYENAPNPSCANCGTEYIGGGFCRVQHGFETKGVAPNWLIPLEGADND